MPLGQIAGVALKKATKNLRNKLKKKATGKPKGRSPSMILGSSSKAGMQSKQGKRTRRPNPMTPRPTGRPPKSVFFRGKPKPKPTGRPTRG